MIIQEETTKPIIGTDGQKHPIYINPTEYEILKCYETTNSIRIIADYKKKNAYIFSGIILHAEVAEQILHTNYTAKQTNYLFLMGDQLNSHVEVSDIMNTLYDLVFDDYEDIDEVGPYMMHTLEKNWNWLYEYIDQKSFEHDKKIFIRKLEKIL